VPSVGPSGNGQQSGAALFYGDQHVVPAQGVKGVLPVHLHGHAAGVSGHASPDDLSHGVLHRPTQGWHKLGYKMVRGHMQPRTKMGPTRLSKHAYTATIKREVAPAQPYADLSQGAWDKRCLRNPTRPYGLVPQPVKQRHRRLAKAPVALHRKGHERVPVERHMQVGRSLLRVPSPYCRSRRCRSCWEYVHIPSRAGCAHGQSHRIVEALASLLVCCPRI
jgi:hypothetical protein